MSITRDVYNQPTAVSVQNDSAVAVTYHNVQVIRNNSLLNWNMETYFVPTGVPEIGLPTTFTLDPGEERVLPITPGVDYSYVLVMMASRPTGDPAAEPANDYLAVRSGPPDARLTVNCVTGQLSMDTGANNLNGFIIYSEDDAFTGLAVLPPDFQFNTNSEDTIASQLGNVLTGLHDFGPDAVDRAMLWDAATGEWSTEWLKFTYTVDGVESVFFGEIELTGELPGDTNTDGVVDAWDIQRILAANSYGNGSAGWSWEQGDFTGDGYVDWADIEMILDHDQYDSGAGGMLMQMIPEPATVAILGLGAIGLLWRRR